MIIALGYWMMHPPLWVEETSGRVYVVGKTNDGTRFNVLVFDRKLLAENGSLTGMDMAGPVTRAAPIF